jgi:two-component system chemotaxis sensor kinase CheA
MSEDDPVAAFRVEAADLLDQVERALLDLAGDLTSSALVDEVFRGLHTLKGSGAMFGFEALARFTHHCETAFDRVRKGKAEASQALIGVVLSARDHMQALIDVGTQGDPMLETAGDAILAALEKAVADGEGVAIPRRIEEAERKGWHISFKLPPGSMANGTNPLPLLDELRGWAIAGSRRGWMNCRPWPAWFPPNAISIGTSWSKAT